MRSPRLRVAALTLAVALLADVAAHAAGGDYAAQIDKWRAEHEAELRADDGWLTVAGLFWLREGPNRFGSARDNDIVFPSGPALGGVLEHRAGKTALRVEPGVPMMANGTKVTTLELKPDISGAPDILTLGRLSFYVIARGGKYGVRLRDLDSPQRKAFTGRSWFPVAPGARVTARFVAYDPPRTLQIPNVLGQEVAMPSPGRAVFRIDGKEIGLDAVLESSDSKELFFIFNDDTSGKGTYPGGRFLYTELPRNGSVVLDFNKAESPPCAFTPFATCPLPPAQNRLAVRIEAGERYRGQH